MMNIHMKAKNSCQISDYLHSSKNKEYKGEYIAMPVSVQLDSGQFQENSQEYVR